MLLRRIGTYWWGVTIVSGSDPTHVAVALKYDQKEMALRLF